MKGIIYKITNNINNKVYIGQTRYTLEFRWRQHWNKKDNTYFHNALHKYGKDAFTIEILEECDYKDLNSKEIFYIAKYDSFNNGYNLTLGGDGNKRLLLDDKYNEIKELYLSGFSSNKIAILYEVDKGTIVKILKSLGIKIRNNQLKINNQEFQEIVNAYNSGQSLKSLAKNYDCSAAGLREFLKKRGVEIKSKTSIKDLIFDYSNTNIKVNDILSKYHCEYSTFVKILSKYNISKRGKGRRSKFNDDECKQIIKMFKSGMSAYKIANHYKVDKNTIYSIFRKYNINYLTV